MRLAGRVVDEHDGLVARVVDEQGDGDVALEVDEYDRHVARVVDEVDELVVRVVDEQGDGHVAREVDEYDGLVALEVDEHDGLVSRVVVVEALEVAAHEVEEHHVEKGGQPHLPPSPDCNRTWSSPPPPHQLPRVPGS